MFMFSFSSCPQSLPASGSFPMSQFFTSGGQSIGASASASVLPMNIQDWFPLGLTGWISLQYKRLSRVFSSTTVQKHQFFSAELSLWSNSHIHTGKTIASGGQRIGASSSASVLPMNVQGWCLLGLTGLGQILSWKTIYSVFNMEVDYLIRTEEQLSRVWLFVTPWTPGSSIHGIF